MVVQKPDVYVGSTVRRKVRPHFHRSDCKWATAIKAWNLIRFSSQEEAVKAGWSCSGVVELLDVPRKVGNLAAHPIEDSATGMIVEVEEWEAEWCLEVIEALYDHFFVAPARNAERLYRLGQKMSP